MTANSIKSIAVFCGSSNGHDPVLIKDCLNLAAAFCSHDITLVYGGGNVGLMGVLADEMLRRGGRVIGVIPEKLVQIEVAHKGLTQLHVVKGMHERKALMTSHSDAFMVLPGGIGTMEEFFEMYTWQQLGYHHKPIAISNINGFYDILIDFLKKLAERDFVKKSQVDRLIIESNSVKVLESLLAE